MRDEQDRHPACPPKWPRSLCERSSPKTSSRSTEPSSRRGTTEPSMCAFAHPAESARRRRGEWSERAALARGVRRRDDVGGGPEVGLAPTTEERVNRNRPGRFPNDALEYLIDRSRPTITSGTTDRRWTDSTPTDSPRMIRHRRQPGTESPATLSRGAPHRRRVPPSRRQASDQCWTPVEWIMYSTREGTRSDAPCLTWIPSRQSGGSG